VLLYLAPGPAGFATAVSLAAIEEQAEANGVTVDPAVREAFNRTALLYDSRVDLRAAFGEGPTLNSRQLIEWAADRPDSSAASLKRFEQLLRRALTQWDADGDAGASFPKTGAPGLPGPS
jgi:hypothetical protein